MLEWSNYNGHDLIGQCSECSKSDVPGHGCIADDRSCDRSMCATCIDSMGVHERPFRCNWCIASRVRHKIEDRLTEMPVGTYGRYMITTKMRVALRIPFFRKWIENHESIVCLLDEGRFILKRRARVPVPIPIGSESSMRTVFYNGSQAMFLGTTVPGDTGDDDRTNPVLSPILASPQKRNGETVAVDNSSSSDDDGGSAGTTDTDTDMYTRDHGDPHTTGESMRENQGNLGVMNCCIRRRASRYMDRSSGISVRLLGDLMKKYGVVVMGDRRKPALCLAVATYEIKNNVRAYNESTEEYVIREITAHRPGTKDTEDHYRVVWEGYVDEDTWEPESSLPQCLIRKFHDGHDRL